MKREADRSVAHGTDITDSKCLYDVLTGANVTVRLFLINDKDIGHYDKEIKAQNIKPVPGTMKIHQVITEALGLKIDFDLVNHCRLHCRLQQY